MPRGVATGRAVQPHLTRSMGGVLQPGVEAGRTGRASALPTRALHVVREGMWAVVNEGGGTAPVAQHCPSQCGQMAGKTGSSQVRRVTREQREQRQFRERQAALGIPPARAVRRLRAVRRAALRRVAWWSSTATPAPPPPRRSRATS